jgi:hypothetical protein
MITERNLSGVSGSENPSGDASSAGASVEDCPCGSSFQPPLVDCLGGEGLEDLAVLTSDLSQTLRQSGSVLDRGSRRVNTRWSLALLDLSSDPLPTCEDLAVAGSTLVWVLVEHTSRRRVSSTEQERAKVTIFAVGAFGSLSVLLIAGVGGTLTIETMWSELAATSSIGNLVRGSDSISQLTLAPGEEKS